MNTKGGASARTRLYKLSGVQSCDLSQKLFETSEPVSLATVYIEVLNGCVNGQGTVSAMIKNIDYKTIHQFQFEWPSRASAERKLR